MAHQFREWCPPKLRTSTGTLSLPVLLEQDLAVAGEEQGPVVEETLDVLSLLVELDEVACSSGDVQVQVQAGPDGLEALALEQLDPLLTIQDLEAASADRCQGDRMDQIEIEHTVLEPLVVQRTLVIVVGVAAAQLD